MNDTMSLVLATVVLATGGLGLYMFKSSNEDQKGGEEYDEDSLFGSGSFWGDGDEDEDEKLELDSVGDDASDLDSVDDYYVKKGRKTKTKTKTTRKPNKGTKKNRY